MPARLQPPYRRFRGVFRIDGLITVVPTVAWKQPFAGLSRQAAPVLAQFFQQFWAEHHISVNASLAALNVNHHPLAVDVTDFQVCQLGVPALRWRRASSAECDGRSERRVDELRDFFLAQDRRKVQCSFRIGSLGDAPGLFESLDVEKPQRREAVISRYPTTTFAFETTQLGIHECVAGPNGQAVG